MILQSAILEFSLLLIFLLTILRNYQFTNQFLIIFLAGCLFAFLVSSFNFRFSQKVRFWSLLVLLAGVFGYILVFSVSYRANNPSFKIHDGAIQTEKATEALISGKNPYTISYKDAFEGKVGVPADFVFENYVYSPGMFILNVPFQFLTERFFNLVDFRITLFIFYFLAVFLGFFVAGGSILFLIIFALNPFFLPLLIYGSNDIVPLFFIILMIFFLRKGRISLATVALAAASSIKILALPLIPLYFAFLYLSGGRKAYRKSFKQAWVFLIFIAFFYLPFAVWDFKSFLGDIFIYVLGGGEGSHVVAGYLGLPQILVNWGFLDKTTSSFPFYIPQIIFAAVGLFAGFRFLKKSLNLWTLCFLFVLYEAGIFVFSRVFQTNYLAFWIQLLILASFLRDQFKKT